MGFMERLRICIIDDYGGFADCKKAVDEYRKQHNIKDELISVDNSCYFWIVGNNLNRLDVK